MKTLKTTHEHTSVRIPKKLCLISYVDKSLTFFCGGDFGTSVLPLLCIAYESYFRMRNI